MSVNFLHILDEVGVETRRTQYNKTKVRTFCMQLTIITLKTDAQRDINEQQEL